MKEREKKKFIKHLEKYLNQSLSLKIEDKDILILIFRPNEYVPHWTLASAGSSDYKMPKGENNVLTYYNEYLMFIDGNENLDDFSILQWYANQLKYFATYPKIAECFITFGYSIDLPKSDEEMVSGFITMPQVIEDARILKCRVGLFKTISVLSVILITQRQLDMLAEIGEFMFDKLLFPDNGDKFHYLCQRYRTEEF